MGLEFDNPKQLKFLERIFTIFEKNIIILDFFAGSASTAHAILNLSSRDHGNHIFILNKKYKRVKYITMGRERLATNS